MQKWCNLLEANAITWLLPSHSQPTNVNPLVLQDRAKPINSFEFAQMYKQREIDF